MNFLIVGHTHASIDQYFSVIAKAIRNSHFIGTPVALMELIRRCNLQLFGAGDTCLLRYQKSLRALSELENQVL